MFQIVNMLKYNKKYKTYLSLSIIFIRIENSNGLDSSGTGDVDVACCSMLFNFYKNSKINQTEQKKIKQNIFFIRPLPPCLKISSSSQASLSDNIDRTTCTGIQLVQKLIYLSVVIFFLNIVLKV